MIALEGRTALVTGASAGIGREIAKVLAREVGTLVLVARRRDRLEELANELRAVRPELRVLVRAVDLIDRNATGEMLSALEREGIAIDVLVNNAGFGDYGLFDKREWPKFERMLELNVVSATFVLNRLIPSMVKRGFGAILNVGSAAGMFPSPGMGSYAATKAYLNHLSEGLRAELAGTGVSVTALCPGPVATEFQDVAGARARPPMPRAFHVDVALCAEESVRALKRGRARVIPGVAMKAAVLSVEAIPKAVVRPFLRRAAKRLRAEA
jgi:short-subunit dehydrogenase